MTKKEQTKEEEKADLGALTKKFLTDGGTINKIETTDSAQDFTVLYKKTIGKRSSLLLQNTANERIAAMFSKGKDIDVKVGETYSMRTSVMSGKTGTITYEGKHYNITKAIDKISPPINNTPEPEKEHYSL